MAFLVFEGMDGSGKTTLLNRLGQELQRRGIDIHVTREPGGTPLAEDVRRILLRMDGEIPCARAELLLYEAARAQHVERVIRPALAAGRWVLCDRFTASAVAFQSIARGLPRTDVDWLNAYAVAGVEPDLQVLLDLPVEESLRRRAARYHDSGQGEDRFEREKQDFHQAVRHGYLQQVQENPSAWLRLDAMQGKEELYSELLHNLEARAWLKK